MEKEYWGSKFYGSKVNTVLLLILIILMIFVLSIMNKDKLIYLPVSGEQGVVTNNPDELNYKLNQDVSITDKTPLAGLHIFGISDVNPSGLSSDLRVIIAAELKFKTDTPRCGFGGNGSISHCSFFVQKSTGEIIKVSEWPDADLIKNHSNFSNGENLGLIYHDNNITFADKDTVYFKSRFSLQCSGEAIQNWQFDLQTHKFSFFGQEGAPLVNDCD